MAESRGRSIFSRWWFWLLVIILVIVIIPKGDRAKDPLPENQNQTENQSQNQIQNETEAGDTTEGQLENNNNQQTANNTTYENFLKIKMGSKYDDVIAILGEGEETSSSEVSGVRTVIYSWNGPGIGNMNVTVQNGVVVGKAQAGLAEMDANVTLEQYNQIKEGMTYEEVKAILGEGELTSQTKILNTESIMYSWTNRNGSNMNAVFTGGKLQSKAQFGLQ